MEKRCNLLPYVWAAIVIALITAGVLPDKSVVAVGERHGERESPAQQQQAAEKKATPNQSALLPSGNDQNPASPVDETDCKGCSEHDKADLYEQRRMAKAAEAQLWVNVGGLVAVCLSLVFTGWAAYAATVAAKAAERSVSVAQDTAQMQLRAYLNYDQATLFDFETDCPFLQISIKNYGHTPAYEVRFRIGIGLVMAPTHRPAPPPLKEWQDFGVVAPQAPVVMQRTLINPSIPVSAKQSVKTGGAGVFVSGEIVYRDAFDNRRRTTFLCLYGGWAEIRPDGHLATCEEGNEAT